MSLVIVLVDTWFSLASDLTDNGSPFKALYKRYRSLSDFEFLYSLLFIHSPLIIMTNYYFKKQIGHNMSE